MAIEGGNSPDFLSGGEMGARIRGFDWSSTAIGALETWSPALRTTVRLLLANGLPMLLWWGPEYVSIYNDAYRPVLGAKHPWALGKPVRECWSEIWNVLKPLIDSPFHGGPPTWIEDIELLVNRSGFTEETHFTVAYSPVPDEAAASGIGGVLATVHEITGKVVSERRVAILREVSARASEAKTAEQACITAANTLAQHPKDIPFALLYILDPKGKEAKLAATAGTEWGSAISPLVLDINKADDLRGWPAALANSSGQMQVVENLAARFSAIPEGPWPEPPHTAAVVPLRSSSSHQPAGFLIAGISSRLRLDDQYRNFLELAAGQIASAITGARAFEEERKRAETLAEIDRAKTVFFSNVSHEFRTPLTLMMGPLEHVLAETKDLSAEDRERLETAHRNSLRLTKLVNMLLDFSRIETGRVQATYEPTDLAAFTAELASTFRSTMERAGLGLKVDCPPLSEAVYVDREMWEKIVLNLLSNAFKFTFEGEVEVSLRQAGDVAEFAVRDTGTGIPAEELPRLFERFHRVPNARGRTCEGSGIGLALVQELVNLHGGTIRAESELDHGSRFTVAIPLGTAHLPPSHISGKRTLQSTATHAEAYVEEALRWLPEGGKAETDKEPASPPSAETGTTVAHGASARDLRHARILLADDNADMREYVQRLLGRTYEVTAVADGRAALEIARRNAPDLVLADIMMPQLDGLELLRELRADARTRETPVILLSARAGEEARVEGLKAGADDYLTKPFSAKELLARVEALLKLQHVRHEAQQGTRHAAYQLQTALRAAKMVAWEWDLRSGQIVYSENSPDGSGQAMTVQDEAGWTAIHPDDAQRLRGIVEDAIARRGDYLARARVVPSGTDAARWMEIHGKVLCNDSNEPTRISGVMLDVTESYNAEEALRRSEERFRAFVMASSDSIYRMSADWSELHYPAEGAFTFSTEISSREWLEKYIHPDDQVQVMAVVREAIRTKSIFELEHRIFRMDGTLGWVFSRAVPLLNNQGEIAEWFGTASDITERKQRELNAAFLADFSDTLSKLSSASEIMQAAGEKIGVYLKLSYCLFAEVDGARNEAVLDHIWHVKGESRLPHIVSLSDFVSEEFQRASRAGDTVAIRDTQTDLSTSAASYAALDIHSFVVVPFHRDGEWKFLLAICDSTPRDWRPDEIELFRELANRVFPRLERARAEDDLRRAEAESQRQRRLYEAILTNTPDLAYIFDLNHRFTYANKVLLKMWGRTLDEAIGKTCWELGYEPWHAAMHDREIDQVIATKQPIRGEVPFTSTFGRRIYDYIFVPVLGVDGQVEAVAGTTRDVTDRKLTEEDLRRANQDLEQFAYSASHDLQEPLRGVSIYSQFLAKRYGDKFTGEALEFLEHLRGSAKRMEMLVRDLLAYTQVMRLETGAEICDSDEALKSALDNLGSAAKECGAHISFDPLPPVRMHCTYLQQVFQNLIGNAIKYRSADRSSVIHIGAERRDRDWIFSVTDNGIGVDPAYREKIFGVFKRLHTSQEYSGTGIGLAICQRIVERYGGRIWVESELGKGARFRFTVAGA